MTEMLKDPSSDERLNRVLDGLANGLIVVDVNGQIVWIDDNTRRQINGGLSELTFPLPQTESPVTCTLSTLEIAIGDRHSTVCVLEQTREKESSQDLVAAIEAIMSDTSWFTRTIVEKLKAWRQAKQPSTPSHDLDLLTDREREILALICEGHSDLEMSKMLKLSQNTVRNHVASLYRKIGVNRRSAAIIWARERAITPYEFKFSKRASRSARDGRGADY